MSGIAKPSIIGVKKMGEMNVDNLIKMADFEDIRFIPTGVAYEDYQKGLYNFSETPITFEELTDLTESYNDGLAFMDRISDLEMWGIIGNPPIARV